jgi:hypothetical protein
MELRQIFLVALVGTLLTGCGGGSTATTPPVPAAIVVTLLSEPNSDTIPVGGTATLSAMVSNDKSNAGVSWSCTPVNACGSFSPASTASGVSTTYSAPAVVPSGGQVTLKASSVTDGSKSASLVLFLSLPQSPISVNISPLPPSTIQTGENVVIGATVSNDELDAGVNWSCNPSGGCGSFSPVSTPSGGLTTFTAPVSAPPGNTLAIVATSIDDNTKSSRVTIMFTGTGTASSATLNGQYAFFLTSPTGNRGSTSLAGSVSLHGDGTVNGGVVDIVSPALLDLQDQILSTSSSSPLLPSSYGVDADGRGDLSLQTANGQTLQFSLVLTSATHASLTEIDGNPGSGSLDLQQRPTAGFAASQIKGGYSFTMTGTSKSDSIKKVSSGGVLTVDGVAGVSNGTLDVNTAGVMSSSSFTGSFSAPDSNGRGTFVLSSGRTLTYYVISLKALRIFEADNIALMGGSAYAQGGSGIFVANDNFYQHSGWSSAGLTVTAGEFFIPESDNAITTGISDSNAGGSPTIPSTGIRVTGSSGSSNPNGTGTLNLVDAAGSSTFNLYVVDQYVDMLDPGNSAPNFHGGGGNALLLHTDANINGTGTLIFKREPPFSLPLGTNSVQLTNSVTTSTATNELDLVGLVTADGAGQLTDGVANYDQNGSVGPVRDAPVTGVFSLDNENPGRFTGSMTVTTPSLVGAYPFISSSATTFHVSYYQITASQGFVIQTDSSANVSGYLIQQLLPPN